ncbi:endonuclease MutS2 [Clostridium sp. OS1-26]|uniref:endonuclease MutS2 n=1 Tax=Clostridium sp. OS1-26 TaxID=3070681 RepID=UPI0027E1029D|nr:endonuclease MutS2 [Clostridium sp. OS1-26]WML34996.1 endonuclease MutS2 [Clostridium sp. OS1-26]
MNNNTIEILEYNKIKEIICEYAISEPAKKIIKNLEPSVDLREIENWMRETTEARAIVNRSSSVPIHSLTDIEKIMSKLGKGAVLKPEELVAIYELQKEGVRLKRFMEDKEIVAPIVSSYAQSIYELKELEEEIERCIYRNNVIDKASNELARIRKKIAIAEDRVKTKLENVLKNSNYRKFLQDNLISMRNGRYVIPIKSEYKREIQGNVLDSSGSGSTVFIEPVEVQKAQDELNLLKIQEENEVYRILSTITVMVEGYERELSINIETMVHYDFIMAKAKYSKAIEGSAVKINESNYINIKCGKHPLIGRGAVPLDFTIGSDYRSLVITGPNTGGKTVALKTVGLLTMMVQTGLHVPVEEESEFAVFYNILVDIGDGQSIEQSLSTFSSHIKNIISIVECSNPRTLVILDEVGAGTDPGEGMGIAVAVLQDIYDKGATILATTHYSEIKYYAENQEGFKNGCMEFDINTLKPLYKLKIGKAGESNAFLIALRLGMRKEIIEKAHKVTYKEQKDYSSYINSKNIIDLEFKNKADELKEIHENRIKEVRDSVSKKANLEKSRKESRFKIGDCVYISTMNCKGIVCELENSKGEVGVMVMKKKLKINHKRLSLYIDKKELYPEDYDFDIIFESKENRKKKHVMERKYVKGMKIELKKKE